jgi:hypothetical protein
MRSPILAVALVAVLGTLAAACAGGAAGSQGASPTLAGTAPTVAYSPLPGNSAAAPLPSDAPAAVRAMAVVRSCGAEILFEEDVDISPVPTAPGPLTDAAANQQAIDCLIDAWQNGKAAVLVVSEVTDEADQLYTIYRLPGDDTVQLISRVYSHSDNTVAWTQTVCRQLSDQAGQVTPADCQTETPIT